MAKKPASTWKPEEPFNDLPALPPTAPLETPLEGDAPSVPTFAAQPPPSFSSKIPLRPVFTRRDVFPPLIEDSNSQTHMREIGGFLPKRKFSF